MRTILFLLALFATSVPTAAQLTADFGASDTSGPDPFVVQFQQQVTGGTPTLFAWDFGDGTTSHAANPSHTYTVPGSYTVSLTVTAGIGNADTETKVDFIEVTDGPLQADFAADVTSGGNPLVVQFDSWLQGASGAAVYDWDFGDGASSGLADPTHTYTTPGTYSVSLAVSSPGEGHDVALKTDYITVTPALLVADFVAADVSGLNPLTVSFTDQSLGAVESWLWDFGDGTTSSFHSPNHTFTCTTEPASHDVSLTVSIGGQTDTLLIEGLVTVDPAPLSAAFTTAQVPVGDNPLLVRFVDQSVGDVLSRLWEFGDGTTSTQASPTHLYTCGQTPASYDVRLTVSIGDQQDSLLKEDLVQVSPAPLQAAFGVDVTAGTNPLGVTFSDQSVGAVDGWLWDFGDGSTSTEPAPTHLFVSGPTPASFDVSLTVSIGGQQDTVVMPDLIQVEPAPLTAAFTATPGTGIGRLETTFSDTSTGLEIQTWDWDLGGGDSADTPQVERTYETLAVPLARSVTLTVSGFGQDDSVEQALAVMLAPARLASLHVIASDSGANFAVEAADVDLDGDLDVVAGGFPQVVVHRQSASTTFGPALPVTAVIGAYRDLALADLDGDGLADLVTGADGPNDELLWHPGTGTAAGFGPGQATALGFRGPRALAAGDLDADGDVDLLAAMNQGLVRYLNTGGGSLQAAAGLFSGGPTVAFQDLLLADLDNDGDQDVLVDVTSALSAPDALGWFAQQAGAFTWQPIDGSLTGTDAVTLACGDLDADGDLDLVAGLAGFGSAPNELWAFTGDGQGGFTALRQIEEGLAGTTLRLADLDGDGDADPVVGLLSSEPLRWYETQLQGWASEPTPELPLPWPTANGLGTADLDGDGDLDVLATLSGDLVWYENGQASAAWPHTSPGLGVGGLTPRLMGGGPLAGSELVSLALTSARPGALSTLVLGGSALGAPFKSGVLGPQPEFLVSGLSVDANGRLVLVTPWPPGLPAGLELYAQHWIVDPDGPAGFTASNTVRGISQ